MGLDGKNLKKIAFCLVLLGLAFDLKSVLSPANSLTRADAGEGSRAYHLRLDAKNLFQNYSYDLDLDAASYSEEEAQKLLNQAKEEIDQEILGENESLSKVEEDLVLASSYAENKVKAKWNFSPSGYLDESGKLQVEYLQESQIVEAQAELSLVGSEYKELYCFSLCLVPREKSKEEQVLQEIGQDIENQRDQKSVKLPSQIAGFSLKWKNACPFYGIKIGIFLGLILILLRLRTVEELYESKKKREKELNLDYADLVGNFAILMGSGMTMRLALQKELEVYQRRKRRSAGFEELRHTLRQMEEGESESEALEKMADRIGLANYRRFVSLLLQQHKKGGKDFIESLNYEVNQAYEAKRILVKKKAEEAGTKLLFPMILMLGIVMAIVIVPAFFTLQL